METENFRLITSLGTANRRKLLNTFHHKTINSAIKFYTDVKKRKYTEDEKLHVFKIMQEEYNNIINNFRKESKEKATKIKNELKVLPSSDVLPYPIRNRGRYVDDNEYRKQSIHYARALNNIHDDLVLSNKRLRPTVEITDKFKKSSKTIFIHNPNKKPDIEINFDSLKMINSAIPELRNAMTEYKGFKIHVIYGLVLSRPNSLNEDDYSHLPTAVKIQTITNMSQINSTIQEIITTIKNRIPEIEHEKSGWKYEYTSSIDIHVMRYEPLRGGSYLPLPQALQSKKCCINIKNEDDKCLMYSILHHIHKDEIKDHPERVSHYTKYADEFDWSGINFPVQLKDIPKVEKIIDYGINVFGYENSVFPLHNTKRQDNKIINLLMIADKVNDRAVNHYVYIKKLDVCVSQKRRDEDGTHTNKNRFICTNCMHGFSSAKLLENHRVNGCDLFEPCKTVMPMKDKDGNMPTIQFKNHVRKFKQPVVIYADFETLIKPTGNEHDDTTSSTTKLADLPPCGYAFNIVSDYPELNMGFHMYRGDNVAEHFIDRLLFYGDKIRKILDRNTPMIITPEQEEEFQKCQVCHICDKPINEGEEKHRDHDHITGLYRGCAHARCNINFNNGRKDGKGKKKEHFVPVYFHNLKGFDGHLIIQGLQKRNFENIKIIAQNFEKYMTIQFADFRILDSFAFMSSSLDTLTSNLNPYYYTKLIEEAGKKESKLTKAEIYEFKELQKELEIRNISQLREIYKQTSNHFQNDKHYQLAITKGVYPYEYMDSEERFHETQLPPIEAFYSQLSESDISAEDYAHAKKVWQAFDIMNLGEYHDLYLKTDVLLLSDVFEVFRTVMMKNYNLDPATGYYTLPNFAWDSALKKTRVVLEQLTDINMYQFCERGIRGGISMITHRHAKANNKYMEDYDKSSIDSYIIYLDANNLYGEAMIQKLPTGGFRWVKNPNIDYVKNFIVNDDKDEKKEFIVKEDIGCFVECDLHYPVKLHDEHNSYPLGPEKRAIKKEELSPYQLHQLEVHDEGHSEKIAKLVPNLNDKKNYVCHIKNLQYYLSKGLVLTKVHRVLEFEQSAWLKPFIDFNTKQRANSKNDFEKDLYKLMSNAPFGKTMEDMRNRVDIQLISDENQYRKVICKPQFDGQKRYSENLIAVKQVKKHITLNKPIYVGVAVLDLSKLHMYKFHYDYIKPKYQEKATLLFTDTDSLCYHIHTEDIYKDMNDDKHLFDRSGYEMDGYRQKDNTNKKVVGKFKDETDGVPIVEFVGLRSKMYSILLDNGKEKKTGKGIKKCCLKKYVKHENYKRCLFGSVEEQRQLVSFNNLRSIDHKIGLYRYTKLGLSCNNDKMYLLDDGITSLAYGHYKISQHK